MADAVLVATRLALHALAERVISPLRVQATGNEIALQVRPDGFGTPELPGGGWVGVGGTDVVRVAPDGTLERHAITSLRAAARHVGLDGAEALAEDPLEVHAGAARVLAEAWALGDEALRALGAGAAPEDDVSPVRLWPEHFDVAIEFGPAASRATYGVSPGDPDHDEPYAYVGPWTAPPEAPFWNAVGFTGAQRPADDAEQVTAFWRAAHRRLVAAGDD